MSNVIVSLAEFYTEYPEFNTEVYKTICPRSFRMAKIYIPIKNNCFLKDEQRKTAIYLLTAHLSLLNFNAANGVTAGSGGSSGGGVVQSASVGEVSVSYAQIPNMDDWSYWLAQTPYGQELLAFFELFASGPVYIGGSLERVF